MRTTTARMSSSWANRRMSFITSSASAPRSAAMAPFTSTTPMRGPDASRGASPFTADQARNRKPKNTRNSPPKIEPTTASASRSRGGGGGGGGTGAAPHDPHPPQPGGGGPQGGAAPHAGGWEEAG